MPEATSERAYAKINLCLDVIGRRPDGMHEVRTVMQSVNLSDRLVFQPSDVFKLHLHGMAASPDNLIFRAAELLRPFASLPLGCEIRCEKRIPIGAGLGGGSTDAAATLRVLNRLWGCGLELAELHELAARLGADVPFLIEGGTALASGTGRTLTWLPDAPRHWLVLAAIEADTETKTGEMYAALDPADYGGGERSARLVDSIQAGRLDYASVGSSFTRPVQTRWKASAAALDCIERCDSLAAGVTGAGPSVFGLFGTRAAAMVALGKLRADGQRAHLLRFVGGHSPDEAQLRTRPAALERA